MHNSKTPQQRALIRGLGLCFDQDSCPNPRQTRFLPLRCESSCKAVRITPTPRVPLLCVEQKDQYIGYNPNKIKKKGKPIIKKKKRVMNKIKVLVKELKKMPRYEGEPSLESFLSSFGMCKPRSPDLDPIFCNIDTYSPQRPNLDPSINSAFEQDGLQYPCFPSVGGQKSEETVRSRQSKNMSLPHVELGNNSASDNGKNEKNDVQNRLKKLHLLIEIETLLEELAQMDMHKEDPSIDNLSDFEDPQWPGKSRQEHFAYLANSCRQGKSRLSVSSCSDTTCIPGKPRLDSLPRLKKTHKAWKPRVDSLPCSLNNSSLKIPCLEPYIGSLDFTKVKSPSKSAIIPSHRTKLLKHRASPTPGKAFVGGPYKENVQFISPSPPRVSASTKRPPRYKTTTKSQVKMNAIKKKSEREFEVIVSKWLDHLKSEEWDDKIQAMKNIRAAAKKKPELLKTKLHEMCLLLTLEVKNQRATLSCAAIKTITDLHFYLQKEMDSEAVITCRALLLKFAQTTDEFLLEQTNNALDVLVDTCTPTRVLPVLINMGLNHLSNAVRVTTAKHLHRLADSLGGEKLLKSGWLIVECLVPAVSKMSMDGSREIRRHGQKILLELSRQDQFLKLFDQLVPPKDRIYLMKILKKMNQKTR